jgi:hypothetical protein
MKNQDTMQELTFEQIEEVRGGSTAAVRENAATAQSICGHGKVKSVTKDGFECK